MTCQACHSEHSKESSRISEMILASLRDTGFFAALRMTGNEGLEP
jgi:hypothetical protein